MVIVPTRSAYDYTQETTIDGVPYQFRFRWNHRGQYATMDVQTREGETLVAGLKLALNAPLVHRHPGRGLPEGEILVIDPSAAGGVVTFADLAERIALVSLSGAEYAAL